MFKKIICLASFVLVLSLVGDVQAATVTWTDTTGDHNWFTLANWDTDTLPTSADHVNIRTLPGPTIADEGALGNWVQIGKDTSPAALTVDGGTLTAAGGINAGQQSVSDGTLNMNSGTIIAASLRVGDQGPGTLNMNGGSIDLNWCIIGRQSTSEGHLNLDGGIITTNNFAMRQQDGAVGTMDVTAGTLIINGDVVSTVQGFIDNGWITAYQGRDSSSQGQLILTYDDVQERTILSAIHNLRPNPIDGGIAQPGQVELSWTLPDPNVPGTPMLVDVYFTDDLKDFDGDLAAIKIVNLENDVNSVVVETQIKKRYYWAVDVDVNADGQITPDEWGPIFSFLADNAPPEVFAGQDIATYLIDGTRTGPLQGTVIDDGSHTVTWSVVQQPSDADPTLASAVIADPAALETTITVSAEGRYVVKLLADDGEYTGEDEMVITVNPDDWPK